MRKLKPLALGVQEDPSIPFEVERVNITRIYGFQIGQIYGAKSRNDFLHIYRDTLVSLVPPHICHGQHYFFVFNRGILSGKQSQGRARDVVCRSLSRVVPVIVTATFHGLTDNLVISNRFWLASQRCPASNYVFSRSAKS
ncbi:hypothetical protein OUZ56_020442 [Daphnia magna]|uniref:Uncharacterized protein n=1 Tax=Daphnia magna TaxID=35525 RepID=A0ABQ9ZEH6_9CRUS|nr:hypothetical protein OUZ56_020442 [Daphnia magna]